MGRAALQQGTTAEREQTTELFARYAKGIYRYCLRRLGSPEEAEDALQVTYLNAWRSLKGGCRPQAQRAWLFQIAANVCASTLRSKLGGARLELREPDAFDNLVGLEEPESEDLLGLTDALRELPSRQRHALVLRDWRGLSYDEIAAEMAVSDAAVETLLFRARSRVAATLSSGEWRSKLATSARALLVWPFAFMHTKSATTGAGHLKMGLGLAGGAVTPLVVFGLVQALSGEPQVVQAARPPSAAASAPLTAPGPAEARLVHALSAGALVHKKVAAHAKKHTKHASSPHAATSDPSATPPVSSTPTPAVSHGEKAVLCHGTHSATRPGVTISVSTHAANGHQDDAPGACG